MPHEAVESYELGCGRLCPVEWSSLSTTTSDSCVLQRVHRLGLLSEILDAFACPYLAAAFKAAGCSWLFQHVSLHFMVLIRTLRDFAGAKLGMSVNVYNVPC